MIPIDLTGKTALITGASQGLGAVMAATLHAAGANVALNYFPDADGHPPTNATNAERLARDLGSNTVALPGDVRSATSATALCTAARDHFGSLDLLINNAGIARDRTVAKMSDEEWQAVIDTNLTGVFNTCRAALPLLSNGGRIVNIASVSGAVGLFGQANYAAAKAGVIGFTKTLSRELARRGITVNAVAPGLVLTELGQTVPPSIQEQWRAQIPLGRFGEPKEIANVVLFLCSPLASYLTGQTVHVNGGFYA